MVQFSIKPIVSEDVPFLWEMLFYAAHMAEEGATSVVAAQENPFLAQYVEGWGKTGDLGFIAIESLSGQKVGAVWVRLLSDDKESASYVDEKTAELAAAVHPAWIGKGIGTALLNHLVLAAQSKFPAIVLTVRADNPAKNLYKRIGFVTIGELENRVKTKSLKMLLRFNTTLS